MGALNLVNEAKIILYGAGCGEIFEAPVFFAPVLGGVTGPQSPANILRNSSAGAHARALLSPGPWVADRCRWRLLLGSLHSSTYTVYANLCRKANNLDSRNVLSCIACGVLQDEAT